jgi:hypothetical protein
MLGLGGWSGWNWFLVRFWDCRILLGEEGEGVWLWGGGGEGLERVEKGRELGNAGLWVF